MQSTFEINKLVKEYIKDFSQELRIRALENMRKENNEKHGDVIRVDFKNKRKNSTYDEYH